MNAPDCLGPLILNPPFTIMNTAKRHVCLSCLGDGLFHELAKSLAAPGECAACGSTGNGLSIGQIAVHLDKLIKRRWYGSFPTRNDPYAGETLPSIIREALKEEHAFEDAIIEALKANDRNGKVKGTFYSDTALYQRRQQP